jgi:hypothetical protein
MRAHSDALRRRWADPVYRDKQIAANRRTNDARKAYFADPLARKRHGQAVKIGYRLGKRGKR